MRKRTTPVHVAAGLLAALLFPYHPGMSWMLMLGFGWYEWQEQKKIGDTGVKDFWEGLVGLFIGAGILYLRAVTGI